MLPSYRTTPPLCLQALKNSVVLARHRELQTSDGNQSVQAYHKKTLSRDPYGWFAAISECEPRVHKRCRVTGGMILVITRYQFEQDLPPKQPDEMVICPRRDQGPRLR